MAQQSRSESRPLNPRERIARIRCLKECISCFESDKPLPEPVCYVAKQIKYARTLQQQDEPIPFYEKPLKTSEVVFTLPPSPVERRADILTNLPSDGREIPALPHHCADRVTASGEELCNAEGQWLKVFQVQIFSQPEPKDFDPPVWLLLYDVQKKTAGKMVQTFIDLQDYESEIQNNVKLKQISHWLDYIDRHYSLHPAQIPIVPPDVSAVSKMRSTPNLWSKDCDADLVKFLSSEKVTPVNENLGSMKYYVENIEVSTYCDRAFCEDGVAENLTDGDGETFWESDGQQGNHWVRLQMKKGTIIKKLYIVVDAEDGNYIPHHIVVSGGLWGNLKKLNEVYIEQPNAGQEDVCILEDMTEHYPDIVISIKECKDDGIDVRLHGIKIKSTKERDLGLSVDVFIPSQLIRYPKLESFEPEVLYRRALLLQRIVTLLDSVLIFLVPTWEHSLATFSSLEIIRMLLPISKKRTALIETMLRESENTRPFSLYKLYIDRRAAVEHRLDASQDATSKNSVFMQIYDGLKRRDKFQKPLDYRWSVKHNQWWECKFLGEGIMDQGGGFRDSLSDLAEELCPSASDVPVPLPFFIRSPNQSHEDSNVNRDVYIPNPSCKDFMKYHWIGQLMGACFRSKENLVLSLPQFTWKQLGGETVTWSRDFVTIDTAEVKLIESMIMMDEETFVAHFGDYLMWCTVLSDGTTVELKPNGANIPVLYDERNEFCRQVQKLRMTEADEQVNAIRKGLLEVVPEPVIQLMSWQQLELRVCGDPEITIDALKKTTHFDDLDQSDLRVKYMWEALSSFSNEDRSRFLRFVTGRRRLPTPLYVYPDKELAEDGLPEASTCSNTLHLPNYSSAKIAEEKLRYAAYNCVAIDTDMDAWDE
ncbi:E3 ubiquitin-protein ligase HECTD3-like [Tubulanus polymorphus]|uniref:E3 ubiquitin-protein ligase HECTD3-like n=1 Tax=Tubulanus polymorphus TaxID=672921 RepID=UPI003DA45D3C